MTITIIIIVVTVLVSILTFNNRLLFDKMRFNAYIIQHEKQWYRFFSYGLLHANWIHLFVNMLVLYSFGRVVETLYHHHFEDRAIIFYMLLYLGGIAFSVLVDFGKNKDNPYYNAVGASGAVAAVVFASIILYPAGKIYLFFIPIGIPAPIFGVLYLVYSAYMGKKEMDNIGHNAHFWGAVFGVVFTIALKPQLFLSFLEQLGNIF